MGKMVFSRVSLVLVLVICYFKRKVLPIELLKLVQSLFCFYYKYLAKDLKSSKPSIQTTESNFTLGFNHISPENRALVKILKTAGNTSKVELKPFRKKFELFLFSYSDLNCTSKAKTIKTASTHIVKFLEITPPLVISKDTVILYIHGGGYVVGSARAYLGTAFKFSHQCRMKVYSLDYTCCPEATIQEQVEEAVELYNFLKTKGFKVVLVGDSAGAGLSIGTVQKLVQNNEKPVTAVLISPWVDISCSGSSYESNKKTDFMIDVHLLEGLFQETILRSCDVDSKHPSVSFINCSFEGFPTVYVTASQTERLYSDSVQVVKALRANGSKVFFESATYGVHDYPLFSDFVPEYNESFLRICSYIRTAAGIDTACF